MDAGRAAFGLVAASAGQLGLALGGLAIALRRGHSYDIPLLHGDSARILRQSVVMGTAFSQPPVMMAAQVMLTAAVGSRGDPRAVRGLQGLGSAMVAGYLAERLVRTRLRRRGWDPVERPLVLVGLWLSAAMVVLGGRRAAAGEGHMSHEQVGGAADPSGRSRGPLEPQDRMQRPLNA